MAHKCFDLGCSMHNGKGCVSTVPIFNHLTQDQMDEIQKLIVTKTFKKGETIYDANTKSDALYVISRGRVRIDRITEDGKSQLIRLLNPGDFTGELSLFNDSIHDSFASAMMNTNICMIKREDLQDLLNRYPQISLKIMSELSKRLSKSEEQSTRLATQKVETRLALYLVESLESEQSTKIIHLGMSKKDLASYLGTSPETISRKLFEFEEAGYIKQISNQEIELLNIDELLMI